MSEARASKPEKPAATPPAAVRPRQTIVLNDSTNEAQPRKGIKRRTDIGEAPAAPAPSSDLKSTSVKQLLAEETHEKE
jgi:hypothetical protein